MKKEDNVNVKVVSVNRKARFNYYIIETIEAGIVLTGSEIKSIRQGEINLAESYVRPEGGEIFLLGAHIPEYAHSHDPKYDPTRRRKLLIHRREIDKLRSEVDRKGMTIVPLQIYLKKGRAKLEIGLAKGKAAPDKRRSIKDRESQRDIDRAMKKGR